MIEFNAPSEFLKFIRSNSDKINPLPNVLSNLLDLRDLALSCCKCIRKEKTQVFFDHYYSIGDRLSEENKSLLKQVAGDKLVFKRDGNIFFEIE
jgi:hypothetical protein